MKLRMILAATALGAWPRLRRWAQTPPIEGGTVVGGVTPSFLELILTPAEGELSDVLQGQDVLDQLRRAVTTTDDTDAAHARRRRGSSGSKLGHLASGSKRLPLPLEARVGKSAFQPLDAVGGPAAHELERPGARAKATVNLRQKVKAKATGSYRKVVLVTLSTDVRPERETRRYPK